MYLYPIDHLRLKHGRHTTPATGDPAEAPSSPGFSQPLSRIDRGSAIALGVLLILILTAAAWFCTVKIKQKREREAEERFSRQASIATERHRSVGGGIPHFSKDKLLFTGLPGRSRADSGMSMLVGSGSETGSSGRSENEEKVDRSWSSIYPQPAPRRQPQASNLVASNLQAPGDHRRSFDRTRSLSPLSQPAPLRDPSVESPTQRHGSWHRRQSSVRSIDVNIPIRRASLSQTRYDKRWWSEVASHGGCTARVNRRLSTLAPILEPEAVLQAGHIDETYICKCGRRYSIDTMDRQSSIRLAHN